MLFLLNTGHSMFTGQRIVSYPEQTPRTQFVSRPVSSKQDVSNTTVLVRPEAWSANHRLSIQTCYNPKRRKETHQKNSTNLCNRHKPNTKQLYMQVPKAGELLSSSSSVTVFSQQVWTESWTRLKDSGGDSEEEHVTSCLISVCVSERRKKK